MSHCAEPFLSRQRCHTTHERPGCRVENEGSRFSALFGRTSFSLRVNIFREKRQRRRQTLPSGAVPTCRGNGVSLSSGFSDWFHPMTSIFTVVLCSFSPQVGALGVVSSRCVSRTPSLTFALVSPRRTERRTTSRVDMPPSRLGLNQVQQPPC